MKVLSLQGKKFMATTTLLVAFIITCLSITTAKSQLSANFYEKTCPSVLQIVRRVVKTAIKNQTRMSATLIHLHYRDCFVNGCDGSILLDGADGEKFVAIDSHSTGVFEVVDRIKSAVESACSGVVSCADILAIAARDAVLFSGGPTWKVLLGRRDGFVANKSAAAVAFVSPYDSLRRIIDRYGDVGLNVNDLVALSGSHTIGYARCDAFSKRLYNFMGTGAADPTMDAIMAADLQSFCPQNGDAGNRVTALDRNSTDVFDNHYFKNLINKKGLLNSDQMLYSADEAASTTRPIVEIYGRDSTVFFKDFARSMVKLANINTLTGSDGEIRKNCRVVN